MDSVETLALWSSLCLIYWHLVILFYLYYELCEVSAPPHSAHILVGMQENALVEHGVHVAEERIFLLEVRLVHWSRTRMHPKQSPPSATSVCVDKLTDRWWILGWWLVGKHSLWSRTWGSRSPLKPSQLRHSLSFRIPKRGSLLLSACGHWSFLGSRLRCSYSLLWPRRQLGGCEATERGWGMQSHSRRVQTWAAAECQAGSTRQSDFL